MSEEYVQPPIDVGFTKPMVLANEPPKEEESTFESNDTGLREAAEERVGETPEPVAITLNDSESGKPRPANETLSAEQAAKQLADYRNNIEDQKTAQTDQATRELIDNIQGNAANPELQAQPVEQQQPSPQPVEAQPAEQLPPGIDPHLARALTENPQLREALQAEVAQIQAAQQSYTDVTRANAQTAAAALFASYPELRGVPGDQIKAAIQVISNQNPQRGAEIVAHIHQVNATVSEWQQAQAQQQAQAHQQFRHQWQQFAQSEDAKAERLMPQLADKEGSRKLGDAAVTTLRNLGLSDSETQKLWNGEVSISLRDHRAQLLLAKAALYDEAVAAQRNAAVRNVPQVMRPGVSGARADEYDQSQLSDLSRRLAQSGNVKDAARLLLARRANRNG